MPPPLTNKRSKQHLAAYAALATQFLVIIGVAVFAGIKTDKWLHLSIPFTSWLLPLLAIILMLYKVYKDTSAKK
jgi:uncharacterized integral membrane protein